MKIHHASATLIVLSYLQGKLFLGWLEGFVGGEGENRATQAPVVWLQQNRAAYFRHCLQHQSAETGCCRYSKECQAYKIVYIYTWQHPSKMDQSTSFHKLKLPCSILLKFPIHYTTFRALNIETCFVVRGVHAVLRNQINDESSYLSSSEAERLTRSRGQAICSTFSSNTILSASLTSLNTNIATPCSLLRPGQHEDLVRRETPDALASWRGLGLSVIRWWTKHWAWKEPSCMMKAEVVSASKALTREAFVWHKTGVWTTGTRLSPAAATVRENTPF